MMHTPIDPRVAEERAREAVRHNVGEALTAAAFEWAQANLTLDQYRRSVWMDSVSPIALMARGPAFR